ncbi:MAG: CDP-alcohol phosphatidyltransferase family protein [Promicromonosporaceae bacterium]|nr:CDP-alcohol phosphatidyltransferase family protein [Promicromonosporaceae bacterium]
MSRIAAVPFFAWALLAQGGHTVTWRVVATVIFLVSAFTDQVDGHLARSRDLITNLGKILDPIADKALTGTALVLLWWPLGEFGPHGWWIPAVVLFRELGITAMRVFLLRYVVLPASRGGKFKTAVQVCAITVFLLPLEHLPDWVRTLAWTLMGLAIAVTLITGIDYTLTGWRIWRKERRGAALELQAL